VRPRFSRLLAIVAFGSAVVVGGTGMAAAAPHRAADLTCRAPRLIGLTLARAEAQARRAGCRLRLVGAHVKQARIQTIGRQSPRVEHAAPTITVWLNPLCFGETVYPPAIKEPTLSPGSPALITGFYLSGGPAAIFSTPGCRRSPPVPGAGSVVVTNATGAVVASAHTPRGRLLMIPLVPGTYTVAGTFGNAAINGQQPDMTEQVLIPPGETVRQDFLLSVP
jgi:hypothetical protein